MPCYFNLHKMKKILLVGTDSSAALSLKKLYSKNYHFTSMSRNAEQSDVADFDVLNPDTFLKTDLFYDGIVYFPGTINLKQFTRLSIDDFNKDYEVNVLGLINILKFYIPKLNPGSSVVFFSSVAAKLGMPFHSSVSMVKSAIVGLCKSLSAEYAPKIRFNCVSPSLFESKMSQRLLRNEKVKEKLSQNNPLGRIGSPKDISSIIHFLLSENSSWITGQDISVDGGMSVISK